MDTEFSVENARNLFPGNYTSGKPLQNQSMMPVCRNLALLKACVTKPPTPQKQHTAYYSNLITLFTSNIPEQSYYTLTTNTFLLVALNFVPSKNTGTYIKLRNCTVKFSSTLWLLQKKARMEFMFHAKQGLTFLSTSFDEPFYLDTVRCNNGCDI